MEFSIFGVDDPGSCGPQDVLMNEPGLGKASATHYLLRSAGGDSGSSILLRARHSAAVEPGVLVAQYWALEWLNLVPGAAVRPEIINEAEASDDGVCLNFKGALDNRHWDEYTPRGHYFSGVQWRQAWPDEVSAAEAIATAAAAWTVHPYCAAGSFFAFDLRHITMVFSISINGATDHGGDISVRRYNEASIRVVFSVKNPGYADDRPMVADWRQYFSDQRVLTCQLEVMQTATSVISPILNVSKCALGARSLLVVGPQGAGKTWMLNLMSGGASSAVNTSAHSYCTVVIARPTDLDKFDHSSFSRGQCEFRVDKDSHPYDDRLLGALGDFLRVVDPSSIKCSDIAALELCFNGNRNRKKNGRASFCVFIDSLEDMVLDEDNGDSDTIVGVALRELLAVLSDRDATAEGKEHEIDLVLVGSCSEIGSSSIKRLCRPPGFDLVRSIHSPNSRDRCTLIREYLSRFGYSMASGCSSDSSEPPAEKEEFIQSPTDLHVEKLSKLTVGYLPNDIKLLLDRAAQYQRAAAKSMIGDPAHVEADSDRLDTIAWQNILKAVSMTPPSRLKSVLSYSFVENMSTVLVSPDGQKRSLRWDDFGGHDDVKARLQILVDKVKAETRPLIDGNLLTSSLVEKPKGIVLGGKPGTGKSYLVQVLASEAKMNFLSVNSTLLLSKYFGETEENIRKLFVGARSVAPCVLFFDEFEVISKKRSMDGGDSNGTDAGVGSRVLSTFLNELDGISGSSGSTQTSASGDVLVIVSCSDVNNLDSAIIRPGRLQYHFVLGDLTDHDMEQILNIHIKSFPHSQCFGVTPNEIVAKIKEYRRPGFAITPAILMMICSNALLFAVKDNIRSVSQAPVIVGDGPSQLPQESEIGVTRSHMFDAIFELLSAETT